MDVLETGDRNGLEVQCSFVRGKNVLLAKASFSPIFVEYFLHLNKNKLNFSETHVELFKTALAAFTLHCASRPRNEVLSWTISFQKPLVNLFLVGDTELSTVSGRIFDTDVKVEKFNSFFQEVSRPGKPIHRSFVDFSGCDSLLAVEKFYSQSEQRPARLFQLDEEEYAMISAHPDWDEKWFKNLDYDQMKQLSTTEEVNLLERRFYSWDCGCSVDKMYELMVPMGLEGVESIFEDQSMITVSCPRCAGKFELSRSRVDALLSLSKDKIK